jgi:hypothetical protein
MQSLGWLLKAMFVVLFALVDANSRKVIRPERYQHDKAD